MSEITTIIGKIESLPDELLHEHIGELATAVRVELNRTLAAGEQPDGTPWAPRKRGTRPVLVHARDAVIVRGIGKQIFVQVHGVHARHHLGWVKGGTTRPMIPTKGEKLPPNILDAMRRVIESAFDKAMGAAP